jgi:hypothetical protein
MKREVSPLRVVEVLAPTAATPVPVDTPFPGALPLPESTDNLTPGGPVLRMRSSRPGKTRKDKHQTIGNRRLQHQLQAA